MNRIARIDRVRNLLAFDLAFSNTPSHEQKVDPLGQILLAFPDSEGSSQDQTSRLRLVGFDEAGRGSLAGPVTVACVSFELGQLLSPTGDLRNSILETYADLNDSKQVTERNRERLYHSILKAADWGIGCASAVEIDHLGIVKACCIAAGRAYRRLGRGLDSQSDVGLFDRGLSLGDEETAESIPQSIQLTRGDGKSFHIAASSILAKVRRDAIMRELGTRAEVYGFAGHKGYGSAAHFEAIREHGPSKFHRRTFLSRV